MVDKTSDPQTSADTHRALAALMARQHGVAGLDQITRLGVSAHAVIQRAACGRMFRIHRGVYSLPAPELLSRDGRYMAAVLACGPDAVLSHRSAADLLELRATDRSRIDVTVCGTAPQPRRRPDPQVPHT